ncbi:MAG TPA: tetratricopeptide repeat protein [Candidatus Dormibacteraeota bacterium]|nr:tetratricopeptide repeat protein [Candidatus Dormibacteraeota bacterium]
MRAPPHPAHAALDSRRGTLLAALVVFLSALAVFWGTRAYAFLNWDDKIYVVTNPWIRAFTWENLKAIFTRPYFQNFLPLHLLSYMLDHAIWGMNAGGYHLSSVLIHAVNSVLCLLVVRRLSGDAVVGLVAALLFAVHPAHVEAVAWVSIRKDLLSTTFLLLSLWSYLEARRGNRLRLVPYLGSCAWFLLGMLSKVSVAPLPAFLLVLDRMPEGKAGRGKTVPWLRALGSKIPYALLAAPLMLLNSRAQVTAQAAYAHEPIRYLAVKGHAVWNYLALLFGREGNPDYDLPGIAPSFAATTVQLAGLLVLPVLAVLLYRWKRRQEFLGVVWVFLTLLPALLFPLVTYMADRYLYAPSIGFCWAIAATLADAGAWRRKPLPAPRALAVGVVALWLLVGFTLRTLSYSKVWKDSDSLWTFAMTKSLDYRVFNNLADVRMQQKRWAEAERLLRRGATVENVTSYQSLGVLYYGLGRYDEALRETDRAIGIQATKRRDPALEAELHFNRGAIFWQEGQRARAVEEWRTAVTFDPGHAQAREWLRTAGAK